MDEKKKASSQTNNRVCAANRELTFGRSIKNACNEQCSKGEDNPDNRHSLCIHQEFELLSLHFCLFFFLISDDAIAVEQATSNLFDNYIYTDRQQLFLVTRSVR